MSLIQEALRRQQEEESGGSAIPEQTSPSAPPSPPSPPTSPPPSAPPAAIPVPPMPSPPSPAQPPAPAPVPAAAIPPVPPPAIQRIPPSGIPPLPSPIIGSAAEASGRAKKNDKAPRPPKPQREPRERGALPTLFGILLVILLLVGGAVWMVMFALDQWQHSKSREADDAPLAGAPALDPAAAAQSPDAERAIVATASDPMIAKPVMDPTAARAAMQATPPAPPPAVAATQPKSVMPVEWPDLTLQGVIGRGANGSAILNNSVLAVNELIKGVRVAAVRQQGVELEFGGERRFIKVGTSTR